MSRGSGQPSIAAPDPAGGGHVRSSPGVERPHRRAFPAGLVRDGGARDRRGGPGAGRAREHVVVLRPSVRDDPRDRGARPDARGHAGRHRPVDTGRHLLRRQSHRRHRRRLRSSPCARDPRLPRAGHARRLHERRPRGPRQAEPANRDAGGGADRPRVEQQVLARVGDEPSGRSRRAVVVGDRQAARDQRRLLDGPRDHARRRTPPALHDAGPALPGRRGEPARRVDRRTARAHARRARVHGGRRPLRGRRRPPRRRAHQHRPGARRRIPPRADRSRRDRRRISGRRARKRDLDVGGGARPHVPDPDAADHGAIGGDAVRRLRGGHPRGDGGLGRSRRGGDRPVAQTGLAAAARSDGGPQELTLERRQFMHRRKESHMRKRPILVVLAIASTAALALVAAATSTARGTAPPASGPSGIVGKGGTVGSGGGFGEKYTSPTATLSHTLFDAKLLPANKSARQIALAAFGRSTKNVNYNLALSCWKNNGCKTGTGGKLTVAYVEGFGENIYRQMSKMEFILQALTYPQIGKILYMSAHSDLNQALADFRSVIAQKVSLIVTYPDFGDAMIPVFQQATKAGIPVATYAWGY